MTSWSFFPGFSPYERMEKNDDYWEEQYSRMRRAEVEKPEGFSKALKICPLCGGHCETFLVLCQRKGYHTDRPKLKIVPAERAVEVLPR